MKKKTFTKPTFTIIDLSPMIISERTIIIDSAAVDRTPGSEGDFDGKGDIGAFRQDTCWGDDEWIF